ncbi:hypothetical protein [Actinospongicola halichondriae]|uniref:hypothetical protein n=1 Tax=Actinospongicola halichondriae TaxID=3236844 RepID=UPI003D4086EC
MTTTVTPSTFTMVEYDAGVITNLVDELAAKVGLSDVDIEIEVDETVPLGRSRLESIDPVHIWAESGALEDAKKFRQFSLANATDMLGRHLMRAADRRSDDFGDPADDGDLSQEHRTAWDIYTVGRLVRLGYAANRQRWIYDFRNRHGFTDVADRVFDLLWDGTDLTWAQLTALSDEAAAANPGKLDRRPA